MHDVGCGRGEFLDLLREAGIAAVGIDVDEGMVERCRVKGHERVERADALSFLESSGDASLGAIFSAQVIEHLPPDALRRFFRLSVEQLRPGGLFIAETVNPHRPSSLKCFWVDVTHHHPIYPEVALSVCGMTGFDAGFLYFPTGSGLFEVDLFEQDAYAVVGVKS